MKKYNKFLLLIYTFSIGLLVFGIFSCDSGGGSSEEVIPEPLPDIPVMNTETFMNGLKEVHEKCKDKTERELADATAECTFKLDMHVVLDNSWMKSNYKDSASNSDMGFKAILDGDGYRICGLTIHGDKIDNQGLFDIIDNTGIVKNLTLINPIIKGQWNVGSLSGKNYGSIENVKIKNGSVAGRSFTGGLVGINHGNIENSFASGVVTGLVQEVGGLVGTNKGGSVTNSYTNTQVTGRYVSNGHVVMSQVGGLIGQNGRSGTVKNSHAGGSVSGLDSVGGLVGNNYPEAKIENSYATGVIKATVSAGGLVGNNHGGIINSFANAIVSSRDAAGGLVSSHGDVLGYETGPKGAYITNSYANSISTITLLDGWVGGLAARVERGDITNSYATGKVIASSGSKSVSGFIGTLAGDKRAKGLDSGKTTILNSYYDKTAHPQAIGVNHYSEGLTAIEIAKISAAKNIKKLNNDHIVDNQDSRQIFKNWDFDNIWKYTSDGHWPELRWQK